MPCHDRSWGALEFAAGCEASLERRQVSQTGWEKRWSSRSSLPVSQDLSHLGLKVRPGAQSDDHRVSLSRFSSKTETAPWSDVCIRQLEIVGGRVHPRLPFIEEVRGQRCRRARLLQALALSFVCRHERRPVESLFSQLHFDPHSSGQLRFLRFRDFSTANGVAIREGIASELLPIPPSCCVSRGASRTAGRHHVHAKPKPGPLA